MIVAAVFMVALYLPSSASAFSPQPRLPLSFGFIPRANPSFHDITTLARSLSRFITEMRGTAVP